MPSTPCSRASWRKATSRTNSLRLLLALAAVLAAPATDARARTDAQPGRKLDIPADPGFEPALRELESRMPAYDAAIEASLRVPSQVIDLGPSAKMYHCWKLRLTGEHGKQVRRVMEDLRSVQTVMKELVGKLTLELAAYAASPKPDQEARRRILLLRESLDSLVTRYDTLVALGKRNGFLEASDGGFFGEHQTVSPRLHKDDYSMVFDDTVSGCGPGGGSPQPGGNGNLSEPSGV
jgi:hypothetical protein